MEQQIERSKVVVRWIVGGALFGSVAYLKSRGQLLVPWSTVLALTAALVLLNVGYGRILRRGAPAWLKYITTTTDLILLSFLVFFTGGAGSVFYFAYFIVLVSNSIRYGMGLAVFVATVYNLTYVAVLSWRPPGSDLTVEAVKILTFWGVALYAGYLAMRFQRQTRILESYEGTIARLRAELAALRPQAK
jgi:hypothetical protein